MRWFKPNFRSVHSLLGRVGPAEPAAVTSPTEDMRQTLLDAMATAGLGLQHQDVISKIRYAGSLQTLWYARSDVMAAVAAERGEEYARQCLEDVSLGFVGLLPEARGYKQPRRPR